MKWTSNGIGRTYTYTEQRYRAMVWSTSTGEWVALISQNHVALAHECCSTLKDAQRWCEAQISALLLSRLARRRTT